MRVDLGSLAAVRVLAKQYKKKHSHLDLLINNAAIYRVPYSKTEDGFESQMGINYLGHFLLTLLLLDLMPDTPESRVVTVCSMGHKMGKIHFDDLQWEKTYLALGAYCQSKLACLMFADELHKRLEANGRKILSVSAHPGFTQTDINRHMSKIRNTIMRYTLLPFVTHSPKEAAKPILLAALGADVKGGEYFGPQGFLEMRGKPGRASKAKQSQDKQAAEKLWHVSQELVGIGHARPVLAPPSSSL
jgi:NAD(P)-dependent dehydrogenase (short-subunit alcohol dehydrogenase family)